MVHSDGLAEHTGFKLSYELLNPIAEAPGSTVKESMSLRMMLNLGSLYASHTHAFAT